MCRDMRCARNPGQAWSIASRPVGNIPLGFWWQRLQGNPGESRLGTYFQAEWWRLRHLCLCLEETAFQGAAGWRLAVGCTGKLEACSSLGWCLRTTESTVEALSEVGTSCEFTGMFWTHSWSRMLMDAAGHLPLGEQGNCKRNGAHETQGKLLPAVSLHCHLLTQLNTVLTAKEKSRRGLSSYQRAGNEG